MNLRNKMKTKGQLKIVMIFLFCTVFFISTSAQTQKYFIITGKIISENENAEGNSLEIAKNHKVSEFQIPGNGRFRLELDYNAEYQLTFLKKGYEAKTIIVNTQVPQEVNSRPVNFPNFLMAVRLFLHDQYATNLFSESNVQEIGYSANLDCFIKVPGLFDIEYVQKNNINPNSGPQAQLNKAKMLVDQAF